MILSILFVHTFKAEHDPIDKMKPNLMSVLRTKEKLTSEPKNYTK